MLSDHLFVSKVNEVYLHIKCEPSIKEELSEYFTFRATGYEFDPRFRAGKWDGNIRLFNKRSNTLYHGLLPYVEMFCESHEYLLTSGPGIGVEDEYSVYHATKFIENLDIPDVPYEHQIDAFIHAMQAKKALILSPTASGKSLIIYLLYRQLLQYQNLKGLVIVPTTQLVEQLYSDFGDYSVKNGFDVEASVHRIYDYQGMSIHSDKKLFISTWQSLKQDDSYFDQFDYIIGDEVHLFEAKSLQTIIQKATRTKYRIGLTGTLKDSKVHKLVLEGMFGVTRRVAKTRDLIDKGLLADINIKCLVLKHPQEVCMQMDYQDEMDYLFACEQRNKFIKNLAVSMKKNTLVLFQRVASHGEILYDLIRNTEKLGDRPVYYIHGEIEAEDRETVRKLIETHDNCIVVASVGTFSTGINIKNLHNIIFASPTKAVVRVMQSIGRTLRLYKNKTAVLYDISDDMRYGNKMNHTLRHFVKRIDMYNEEKFAYKLYKIGLKK